MARKTFIIEPVLITLVHFLRTIIFISKYEVIRYLIFIVIIYHVYLDVYKGKTI